MDKTNILKIKNLNIFYGDIVAVENMNLEIFSTDYIAIIGSNGSGKSTLIKYILGLRDNMKISVDEAFFSDDIFKKKGQIGYLSQKIPVGNLGFPATVIEIISTGLIYTKLSKKEKNKRIEDILKEFKIEEIRNKKIGELSGGQLQKVLLARTIIGDKKLLVLDEPLSSIDEVSKKEIYNILDKRNKEGLTILMITHDLEDALARANKILSLEETFNFLGTTKEYIECRECKGDI